MLLRYRRWTSPHSLHFFYFPLGICKNIHKSCITNPNKNCNYKSRLLNKFLMPLKNVQMKNLRTITLSCCLSFLSFCAVAQSGDFVPINEPSYNKSKLFQNLPDNIPVNMDNISSLFVAQVGRMVSLDLSSDQAFRFDGEIVSIVSKYENKIQSVIVRSTNYNEARLIISKITDVKGSISYTGRILSMQHGDLFELKNINSQLVLEKRKFNDLVSE